MKRPVSHEINEEAKAWFNAQLPREWIRNEHHTDYGIDFTIELVKANDVTGITFLVQLKGQQEAILTRGGQFAFSLERKHAKYYADKARQPVFLVIVDLASKSAYWVFVQKFLDDLGNRKNWRSKSKVVVHVPKENELSKKDCLEDAVISAHAYMTRKQVRLKEVSLQNLDPRFKVFVRQLSTHEEVIAQPIEPVPFTLHVSNDRAIRKKLERLIEEGLPAEFLPGEFRLEGSLLLEELIKKGVVIQPGGAVEGAIVLSAFDAAGVRLSDPLIVPAKVIAGTKFFTFEAKLNGGPLEIVTSMAMYADRSNIRVRFDIEQWRGGDLHLLPHFDRICSFLEQADAISRLEIRLEVNGSQLACGDSENFENSYFKNRNRSQPYFPVACGRVG